MTNPLSNNPANIGTLDGLFRFRLSKFLMDIDDMLPAVVVAYNRTKNRAQVQPLISMVTTRGTVLKRAQLVSIPVWQDGGGGALLSFNLNAGDLGWIKSNDRDISLFKQTFQQSIPNTKRKHSFSDAIFLPDNMTGYTIAPEDNGNAVFQTNDGTVKIALWPTKIKMLAPNTVITDATGYGGAAGAVLDVQSTTKAFKFPSMTTTQKNAISSPQPGFAVFDVTLNRLSVYAAGTGWS